MNIKEQENRVRNYQNNQKYVDLHNYLNTNYIKYTAIIEDLKKQEYEILNQQIQENKLNQEIEFQAKKITNMEHELTRMTQLAKNDAIYQKNDQNYQKLVEKTNQLNQEIQQLESQNQTIQLGFKNKLYYKEYEMMIKEKDGLVKKNNFMKKKIDYQSKININ